jgi:nicotinate-nucleotide adenylyltransferase
MKIAMFGGSFDPIHCAHMACATAALERFNLDQILFVPADIQPLKQERDLVPLHHRYAMLSLATRKEKRFVPCMMESGISYTSNTVRQLLSQYRYENGWSHPISLIVGRDAFNGLKNWHEQEYLRQNCHFIVANRPGYKIDNPFGKEVNFSKMNDVCIETSATNIRRLLGEGKRLNRYIIDPLVMQYIQKTQLYQIPRG